MPERQQKTEKVDESGKGYIYGPFISPFGVCLWLGATEILPMIQTEVTFGGKMVSEGRGRLFRRKDSKFLIYLPKDLAEDSMFPFRVSNSIYVKVAFEPSANEKTLTVTEWEESVQQEEK